MAMYSQSFGGRSTYLLEEQVQGYGLMYPPAGEMYHPAMDGPPGYSAELDYDGSAYDRRSLSAELLPIDENDRRGYERGGRFRYADQERDDRRHRDDVDYKDRERDRDRSRRKDRERDRRRDSRRDYRDRDRRERRDRDRDSGGRSPTDEKYEGSSHSLPSDYEDRESRLGLDPRDDNAGSKWMTNTPTHTILIRCLPTKIDENDIRAELMMQSIPVKDVRVMRRKETGTSRGFAFVEFQNTADAQRWMEQTQGSLLLLDKYKASLYYSAPKTTGEKVESHKNDWSCNRCGAHNFKRRDYCFKCGVSREESERTKQSDGFDQVGTNPCNTLIFRGLDALTTEDTLMAAITEIGTTTLKNIRIIRDQLTNTSQGYGFAELPTCQESTVLLSKLKNKTPAFEVDGKLILVSFAKNTFNTVMATLGKSAEGYQSYDYSAYYDYSNYYGQQTGSTNSAAAVAQAAIQQAQAAKQYATPTASASVTPDESKSDTTDYPKYPAPDVSTYQYEETSGYYYDPSTGLYYDANSQYYYNAQTSQFMYWDQGKSTYLPAPTQTSETDPNKETKKEKEKKEKVKVAKKIAKDMEKWAKSLNAQKGGFKDIGKKGMPSGLVGQKLERESATADAGFAILEKSSSEKPEENWLMPPPAMPVKADKSPLTAGSSLVDYGGGDSDSEEDDNPGSLPLIEQLIDWGKMACLLCKRQFNTPEMLNKHTQLSGLHKQNLETLVKNKAKAAQIEAFDKAKEGYRDRAKERRQKYGIGAPPSHKKKPVSMFEDAVIPEQPTKAGLGQDNIGNKLLQKMGWSLGQGLGKAGQGIVDPIEASQRVQQAGLGARGANVVSAPGDTYKEIVKKTMFARFHEVE